MKIGNVFFDIDKNGFNNMLQLKETIVPYAWHSFCISIDLVQNITKLYHNDHIQMVQRFTITHNDTEGLYRLMTKGHLGGSQFVGLIADFQMFGSVLSEEIVFQWTSCQAEVY